MPEIYWPLPPDQPRMKYVAYYRGILDFPRTSGERLQEILFGRDIGPYYLKQPAGLATDSQGRILVADSGQGGLLVINIPAKTFDLWGHDAQLRLAFPVGVAVDSQDNVYVSDVKLKMVLVFDKNGKLIYNLGSNKEFVNPAGLAVDKKRNLLFVADSKANKVKVFDLKGKLIKELDGSGQPGGKFFGPANVAVDKDGNFYVVDAYNFRVQIFDAEGKFVRAFGEIGDGFGNFARPKGIAVDSEGHIYVVDAAFENFQVFDQQGRLLLFVGTGGLQPGQFSLPHGIWIDKDDKIYVTDQGFNPRVQVFQYLKK
jgi:DNA-binding beta-propeller fold protein YncE